MTPAPPTPEPHRRSAKKLQVIKNIYNNTSTKPPKCRVIYDRKAAIKIANTMIFGVYALPAGYNAKLGVAYLCLDDVSFNAIDTQLNGYLEGGDICSSLPKSYFRDSRSRNCGSRMSPISKGHYI